MNKKKIKLKVKAELPTKYGKFWIYLFEDAADGKEHIALVKGEITGEPVAVRIHSECITGDVFHSLRCDCGDQLDLAMDLIGRTGGVVLYLRQEGRGIGLFNKLKAYILQDGGLDTVEANEKLGFGADLRDYEIAVKILSELGVRKVKLLTNNPQKGEALERSGFEIVDCIPIEAMTNYHNRKYLRTKKEKMGHRLAIK